MKILTDQIRATITFENAFDEPPGFVETCWLRLMKSGVWRSASPFVSGIRILVKCQKPAERIHVFWVLAESLRFDGTPVWLENGKAKYAEPPFLPQPGDIFAYRFDCNETLFDVSSVSHENESVLRIEAEPNNFLL